MNAAIQSVPTPSRDRARARRNARSRTRTRGRLHHPTAVVGWPSSDEAGRRFHRPGAAASPIVVDRRSHGARRAAIADMSSTRRIRIAASMLCTSAVCASSASVLYLTRDTGAVQLATSEATTGSGAAARTPAAAPNDPDGAPRASGTGGSSRSGTATPTAPVVRHATLAFTGDVLIHGPVARRAKSDAAAAGRTGYDFDSMLAPIAPRISGASLAICVTGVSASSAYATTLRRPQTRPTRSAV